MLRYEMEKKMPQRKEDLICIITNFVLALPYKFPNELWPKILGN